MTSGIICPAKRVTAGIERALTRLFRYSCSVNWRILHRASVWKMCCVPAFNKIFPFLLNKYSVFKSKHTFAWSSVRCQGGNVLFRAQCRPEKWGRERERQRERGREGGRKFVSFPPSCWFVSIADGIEPSVKGEVTIEFGLRFRGDLAMVPMSQWIGLFVCAIASLSVCVCVCVCFRA